MKFIVCLPCLSIIFDGIKIKIIFKVNHICTFGHYTMFQMFKTYCLFLFTLLLCSCGVRYKSIPYFVDLPSGNSSEKIENQRILKIQKDDILAITVSSLNPDANAIFNAANGNGQSGSSSGIAGFIVDKDGDLHLPYLGATKVAGLSTAEARDLIQDKLKKGDILKQPIVTIRLANFKVSVLGDVARPGVYPIASERITVIEALSMAGDLNISGKRNDILLIRENQGQRDQIRLNIQSKVLFNSPYYYLQNNDVLVITPSSAKYDSIDSSYRNIGLALSVLSVLALLIARF